MTQPILFCSKAGSSIRVSSILESGRRQREKLAQFQEEPNMRDIIKPIVVAAVATVPIFGSALGQGAPPIQARPIAIQSHPSTGKKCLGVPDNQFVPGMRLNSSSFCDMALSMGWYEPPFKYDRSTQRLSIGHLCVESQPSDLDNAITLEFCSNAFGQRWNMVASGAYYQIVGPKNRCIAIKAGQPYVQICQAGNTGQLWALIPVPTTPASKCKHIAARAVVLQLGAPPTAASRLCASCAASGIDFEVLRTSTHEWITTFVNNSGKLVVANWDSVSESTTELLLHNQIDDLSARIELFTHSIYLRKGNTGEWELYSSIIRLDC
jgi:hypothetical protein